MTTERRLYPRKTPTEFTYIQLEQEFGGRVLNYSKDGLCFETSTPICSSDLVQFWVSFRRHDQIDGVGKITWLSDKKNLGGITFVHLSRASRQKIDEWSDAVPKDNASKVADRSKEEESPQAVVSEIMERVLRERRKPPMVAPPLAKPSNGNVSSAEAQAQEDQRAETSSTTSSVLVTPPVEELRIADAEPLTTPGGRESAETPKAGVAPAIAATAEEFVTLTNRDKEAAAGAPEAESIKMSNSFRPPASLPMPPESLNLWSMTGVTGAKDCEGEQSAAEPRPSSTSALDATASQAGTLTAEQIDNATANAESALPVAPVRKWPVSTPHFDAKPTEQIDAARNDDSWPEAARELVPLKQYLYARRSQFLKGAGIGILLCFVIAMLVLRFRKPAQPITLAVDTASAVVRNSSIAKGDELPGPASAMGQTQVSDKGAGLPKKGQGMIAPAKPPSVRVYFAGSERSSGTSEAASIPISASISGQNTPDTSKNAMPRPSSFANRNSTTGNGSQDLFGMLQPGNSDELTGDAEPGNGQAKVEVGLGSTPWTFRRRNIHGTPRSGGELQPAQLINYVTPYYPAAAKAQQLSGEVVIDAMIDTAGNVRRPQVVSGPQLLRAAALNAVSAWKYKPALLDGKPTEIHETITVRFRVP